MAGKLKQRAAVPRRPADRTIDTVRILLALAFVAAGPVHAADLTVLSWGGDFTAAQDAAMARPFAAERGVSVRFVDSDDPLGVVAAQVQASNVTVDVASVGQGAAMRLCGDGLAVPIDAGALAPAPDGAAATQDFMPGTLGECFVPTDIYSTVIAYDRARMQTPPVKASDFFDLDRFPGRRGLSRTPQFTLELALMADGVPRDQVYALLATQAGVDRAFAKLDTIKDDIVWWEAGSQPVQLLADGEVAMTAVYNGRVFKAAQVDGLPLAILWDAQIYELEGWVIPKGAPKPAEALDFVRFSTAAGPLARVAELLPYGPPRLSAQAMVGNFAGDGVTPMTPHLPTAQANLTTALAVDPVFWAEHETELRERFAAWLAAR